MRSVIRFNRSSSDRRMLVFIGVGVLVVIGFNIVRLSEQSNFDAEMIDTPAAMATQETPPVVFPSVGYPYYPGDWSDCNFASPCLTPDGKYWVHQVTSGDTIKDIANYYGSSVEIVINTNRLDLGDYFEPPLLYIPAGISTIPADSYCLMCRIARSF